MSVASSSDLRHRRVMVVEDEYMIAEVVAEILLEVVAEVIGPVGSVAEALHLATTTVQIDGAVLDVNLQGQKIWPVVDALEARGVPIVLTTGYGDDGIPAAYAHLPRCLKPATGRDLVRALACALSA